METHADRTTEITLLWTAAQPSVLAFIRSVTPQLSDAEDILQETAKQIVARFEEYDPTRPFAAWAIGVARYKVMEWRRKEGRRDLPLDDEAIEAFLYCEALDKGSDFGALGLAQAYLAKGEFETAIEQLDRENKATPLTLVYRGAALLGLGDTEAGLGLLEEAVKAGYGDVAFLETSEYFDSVRGEARFGALVEASRGD